MANFKYYTGSTWADVPDLAHPEDESGSIRLKYPEATDRDGNGAPCGMIGLPEIEIKSETMQGTGWDFWQAFFADEAAETADVSLQVWNERVGDWLRYAGELLRPRCESIRPGSTALATEYRGVALTVINAEEIATPTITAQPSNASVSKVRRRASRSRRRAQRSYQWQVDDGGGWANVSTGTGGTTASYTTPTTTTGMDGYLYRCAVSNTYGTTYSNSVSLSVAALSETGLQPYVTAFLPLSGSPIGASGIPAGETWTSTDLPSSVTGPVSDTAASFDGVNDVLVGATALDTHLSTSVLFWFKSPATWDANHVMFETKNSSGGIEVKTTGTTGEIQFAMYSGGGGDNVRAISIDGLSAATWYCIALTNKQSSANYSIKIYKAALSATTFTESAANPLAAAFTSTPTQDSSTPTLGANIAQNSRMAGVLKNFLVVDGAMSKTCLESVLALDADFTWADLAGVTPAWET